MRHTGTRRVPNTMVPPAPGFVAVLDEHSLCRTQWFRPLAERGRVLVVGEGVQDVGGQALGAAVAGADPDPFGAHGQYRPVVAE